MKSYAIDKGIDPEKLDAFFDDFRDWAFSKGATYIDWEAGFRTRVNKAKQYGQQFLKHEDDDQSKWDRLRKKHGAD